MASLSKLMHLLLQEAPTIGFGLRSIGHGDGQAFGLAMCRGDITSSACTACIHEANDHILHHCPFEKEATVWLEHCLVRYADREFFGEIDDIRKFYVADSTNVSQIPVLDAKVEELMERLVKRAYLTPLLFATGEIELGTVGSLFGLVQCTRDLSGGDCRRCLNAALAELPRGSHGGRGGSVFGGSCNIRYELYPFYDSS
ncbi:cysteine-rich repeat secretory protein 38-like [Phalaenopsis equestris]|uniref:cysteine-rich repeat secretory protein 38-like n=1 Tax=Phalaenopsis equestris TaxID=78828 RepID=UPI0009E4B643|nr:cysteine-rich repeat secretory protein 38-like [Phalaenopsis equestris]